jgi:tRNA (Thr-GGU) A37 N-methylase
MCSGKEGMKGEEVGGFAVRSAERPTRISLRVVRDFHDSSQSTVGSLFSTLKM